MKTIKELVDNKSELIALKKAEIKTVKGGLSSMVSTKTSAVKGVFKDGDDSLQRTVIGNTYLWMDSHDDIHAKGCFKKSIKERSKSVFHLHDHEFKLTSKVGEPIKVYEETISWKELNINKEGTTEALFMDTEIIKEYNLNIYNSYKKGQITQHSVGMQYSKIDLAVNDEAYEDEYKVWKDNIDSIGNKAYAEEKGFFWLVREAKLIEISAVLLGSNELTPTMANTEPQTSTQKSEPSKDTQFKVSQALQNLTINL